MGIASSNFAKNNKVAVAADTQPDLQPRVIIPVTKRMVYKLIPDLRFYTSLEPSKPELIVADKQRQTLTNPESYLEFYCNTLQTIKDSKQKVNINTRGMSFKNNFLTQLVALMCREEIKENLYYDEAVEKFVLGYKEEGVEFGEYGIIGLAVVSTMKQMQKNQGPPELWPKLYSRFVRGIVRTAFLIDDDLFDAADFNSTDDDDDSILSGRSKDTPSKKSSTSGSGKPVFSHQKFNRGGSTLETIEDLNMSASNSDRIVNNGHGQGPGIAVGGGSGKGSASVISFVSSVHGGGASIMSEGNDSVFPGLQQFEQEQQQRMQSQLEISYTSSPHNSRSHKAESKYILANQ